MSLCECVTCTHRHQQQHHLEQTHAHAREYNKIYLLNVIESDTDNNWTKKKKKEKKTKTKKQHVKCCFGKRNLDENSTKKTMGMIRVCARQPLAVLLRMQTYRESEREREMSTFRIRFEAVAQILPNSIKMSPRLASTMQYLHQFHKKLVHAFALSSHRWLPCVRWQAEEGHIFASMLTISSENES